MRSLAMILTFAFFTLCSAAAAEKPVPGPLSGPYAVALAADGATICWQTEKKAVGLAVVKAEGAAEAKTFTEPKAVEFHALKVTGLAAGTEHQVEVFSGAAGGPALGTLRFRTAPQAGAKDGADFAFFAYGDTRTRKDAHEQVIKALVAEVERLKQHTFVLHTGDFAQGGSDEEATAEQFFRPAAPLLARLPLVPVRGNHEGGTDLFPKYFPIPDRPEASGHADDLCFDYGSVRILALDQYTRPKSEDGRMKWLAEKLAEAKDRWRFVTFHEPMYSTGSHGGNVGFRKEVESVLIAGKVHAVFVGHDHNYERTKPINGITHLTIGGGGAPLRGKGFDVGADWSVKFAATVHFLTVAVSPDKLSFKVFGPSAKGDEFEAFDAFEIPKDCAWPGARPGPRPEPKPAEPPAIKPAA
ncbi:MAG TPA: metallophosphoesterase [Planctomycetota bacterium]|nr:metallophosphoesterase [Planctomycetota bacterium]